MKAKIITTIALSIIGIIICSNHVSALEYTTNYGNSFTLLPSISVSLSSPDLIIDDLLPNTSSDSNEIIVNVESNNSTGYVLNSSVGNSSTYASNLDNLVNTASNNYKFTNLALDADLASIDDSEENNVWGYSYSDQTVATPTWSSYSGLPLYSDTTNIATLKSSNTPSSASGDNIGFKIAAKASITQGSGEYTNIINFIAVGNPTPTSFYDAFATAASQPGSTISQLNGYYKMQDMTADICGAVDIEEDQISLIDVRDNNVYTVAKLKDNRCWMTSNLRLGTSSIIDNLTTNNTNMSPELDFDLPASSTGNFADSYSVARLNSDSKNVELDHGKLGVYYNYCAASAGTYCSDNGNVLGALYDICPSHWRLATGGDSGEFMNLYNSYTGDNQVANFIGATRMLLSGGFYSDSPYSINVWGQFWTSTYRNSTYMYVASYEGEGNVIRTVGIGRQYGRSVRCIANNE